MMRLIRSDMLVRTLLATLLAATLVAAVVVGADRVRAKKLTVNPANHPELLHSKLDPVRYDRATRCVKREPRGAKKLARWMKRHSRKSAFIGIIRCEALGSGMSVHSEGRAVDIALDARDKRDKRQAMRMIRTWLEPDEKGRHGALARRMGIQMIIYNCKWWQAGDRGWSRYGACSGGKRGANPTAAHIDHIHVELTRPAAKLKTSYWEFIRSGGNPEEVTPPPPDEGGVSPRR